jgi:PAS domain S-box-containing protein
MAITTAVLGLSGVVAFRTLRIRESQALVRQTSLNAQRLAEGLMLPLWNYDVAQVGRILENEMSDPVVIAVRVHTDSRDWSQFRAGVPEAPAETLLRQGYQVENREIRRGPTVLGTLEVFFTQRYLQEDLRRAGTLILLGIVGFDLLLVMILYWMIWAIVLRPVRALEHYAEAVCAGQRPAPEAEAADWPIELRHLQHSIDGMVGLLDQRYANLEASEQRFRAVLNGSSDAIFVREFADRDQHTPFLEVNEAACLTLGYSREELLRLSPYDLEPSGKELEEARRSLLARGHTLRSAVHRSKGGREIQVEINSHRFEFGGRTFEVSVCRDVSERLALEEQLRHSQKLESVGLLAGGVAHDFNNILQVIIGFASSMEEGLPEGDPGRMRLGRILSAAQRASQLTQNLLTFSRKETLQLQKDELNALVTRVDDFLKRVISEDIDLVTHTSPQPLEVMVDEGQIHQVLINLATNARDAMPKGGILRIETHLVEIDEEFIRLHGFGKPGTWGMISVSDTGHGMDEATRTRIFDPFFTTKAPGKGTGLGLSIVYGIVTQHGGQINVYSEPGSGTTFRIYLPISTGGEPQAPSAAPQDRPVQGTETILVAEDDEAVRSLVSSVLTAQGYRVILAQDGLEAVSRYQENAGQVDLLLLDLIMPNLSGKAAFEAIRREWPGARALFASGYTADIVRSRGELDESAELVMKPIAPVDLLRKIRSILDRNQGLVGINMK